MNVYMVVGRLARDPDVRTTSKGTVIAKLSIPTDDGWGERKKTTWHKVTVFGKAAELLGQYKKKGDWVAVSGRLEIEEWEDKNGGMRTPRHLKFTRKRTRQHSGREHPAKFDSAYRGSTSCSLCPTGGSPCQYGAMVVIGASGPGRCVGPPK